MPSINSAFCDFSNQTGSSPTLPPVVARLPSCSTKGAEEPELDRARERVGGENEITGSKRRRKRE